MSAISQLIVTDHHAIEAPVLEIGLATIPDLPVRRRDGPGPRRLQSSDPAFDSITDCPERNGCEKQEQRQQRQRVDQSAAHGAPSYPTITRRAGSPGWRKPPVWPPRQSF